ncbi:MAG: hypothetical protein JNL13_07650 [Chitinophagaceae bacterium]|nr:hypothetical protein [Chitinophagaceae bacterium]
MNKLYKQRNFYALVTTLTVAIMFTVISTVIKHSAELITNNRLGGILISVLLSSGIFTTLSAFLSWLFEKIKRVKELLLRKQFIEGIWVGYAEYEGKVSYIVERIEQSFEGIFIVGRSYSVTSAGSFVLTSSWKSTVAKINVREKELQYTYINISYGSNDEPEYTGFASFGIENFQNKKNKYRVQSASSFPLLRSYSMIGKLNDFTPKGKELTSVELKITDELNYELDGFMQYAYNFWKYDKLRHQVELHV